ncbi:MAG: hypothetical protein LBK58_09570 [Prevotellaceae bacterium]|jgi:uncharacterized membrane protein|nr:hypothetical protein [Prevotellaceae bacterium]
MGYKERKTHLIFGTLIGVLFILVILALIFALADVNYDSLQFSLEKMGTLMGIFVSIFSLIITVFFAVISVSARNIQLSIDAANNKYIELEQKIQKIADDYEQFNITVRQSQEKIKQINEAKEKIENDLNKIKLPIENYLTELENRKKELDTFLYDYAQSLYDGFEVQIGLASSSGTSVSLLKDLYIKRARLSYKYPMLDVFLRKTLLNELGGSGGIQDVIPIQNIIDNENEPEEIKKIARKVLEELKKRLGIN